MRIAMIAPPWVPVPPPAYGGTESMLDDLCRALAGDGHDLLLYTTGDSSCPVPRAFCYETARGTLPNQPEELRHVIDAYDVIRAWEPDVVHDHTLTGPLLERGHGLARVTTNHGLFEDDLLNIYREIARHTAIVAISHHQASTADGVPIGAVIPHGIDMARIPVGAGAGGFALFLGRMAAVKGVDVAIETARTAGMPLRIAAKLREPAEQEYFDERVRPHLGQGVEYVGEVGGDEKLELLGDAACLLNPIQWDEPFGLVMIEALASGTPVIATPRGAASEIVNDGVTGYVAQDVAGLAAAIDLAPSLDRDKCRTVAEARFSATRMATDHVELYRQVAG